MLSLGRFLKPFSADDILFGTIFDRPLKLPWGTAAVLQFIKCAVTACALSFPLMFLPRFIDPALEHDLASQKPYALSPLIATMPNFSHRRLNSLSSDKSHSVSSSGTTQKTGHSSRSRSHSASPLSSSLPPFPPTKSIRDDTSQLHLASIAPSDSGSSSSASNSSVSLHLPEKNLLKFSSPKKRRSYFSVRRHRQKVEIGPHVSPLRASIASPEYLVAQGFDHNGLLLRLPRIQPHLVLTNSWWSLLRLDKVLGWAASPFCMLPTKD